MNAQDTDRGAIASKFRSEINAHTLDDATGKAPHHVCLSLRSDAHVEAWQHEILRLLAKTPDGELRDRLNDKLRESNALLKSLRFRQHNEMRIKNRPDKAAGSGANRGQMAAMILSAHIKAGTSDPVTATMDHLDELLNRMTE